MEKPINDFIFAIYFFIFILNILVCHVFWTLLFSSADQIVGYADDSWF